ncbi:MAG: hypothetical protein ACK4N5_21060 [Myxococcales bacterium]
MHARAINVLLGIWLVVSAFLWTHTGAQRVNTVVVGVLCVAFSVLAAKLQPARFLNTLLAVWLFISAFALPSAASATVWNNALIAVMLFMLSMMAGGTEDLRPRRTRTA